MRDFPTDGVAEVDRRTFVSLLGAGVGTLALPGSASGSDETADASERLEALSVYSTASQIAPTAGR